MRLRVPEGGRALRLCLSRNAENRAFLGLLNLCCTTSAARANLGTLAHPKQRFCCLWGKAARAGQADASLWETRLRVSEGGRVAETVPFPQGIACLHSSIGSEMPRLWAVRHPFAVLPAERRRLWRIARGYALLKNALPRLTGQVSAPFCAHKGSVQPGESQQGYRPVWLHGGMQGIARWRAAAAVGCGFGLFIPVVAQMPFRRGGRLLWKAACGSLDPCWPRQAAP